MTDQAFAFAISAGILAAHLAVFGVVALVTHFLRVAGR